MILGVGIDVVHPQRLRRWQAIPGLLERFYHHNELAQVRSRGEKLALQSLAARFAAKEAFGKALGSGLAGLSLRDMAVMNNAAGKPELRVTGSARAALERIGRHPRVHLADPRAGRGAGHVHHRGRPRGDMSGGDGGGVNVKLTLAYDGTDFAGWQVQREQRTVQGVVEAALGRMLETPVRVRAAGRTDSGVHALGQVANFSGPTSFPGQPLGGGDQLQPAVRRARPRRPAGPAMGSTAAARRWPAPTTTSSCRRTPNLPHLRRYCLQVHRRLDLRYLNRAAGYLVGEHDFSVFAAAGDSSASKVRRVLSAGFYPRPPFIVFRVVATSFLWKMVRSMLGTLLELAALEAPVTEVQRLLAQRTRAEVGQTAPARGLFLERVWYPAHLES